MEQSDQEPVKLNQPAESEQPADIDQRIVQYVRDVRNAGFHEEIIWDELKKVGWSDDEIKKVIRPKVK